MPLLELLTLATQQQASDLHLSPGSPPLLRIHGRLTPSQNSFPLSAEIIKSMLYSVMNPNQQQAFETQLELDFALTLSSSRFRVHIFHQVNGIAAVCRVIPL